jgi:hypothetical protein
VTVPTPRRARAAFELHFAQLAANDRTRCDGIPATALPRTFLDLAALPSFRSLDRCLDRAEELRLLDVRAIEDVLARNGGHPGRGKLRQALDIYRPEAAFTRSGLERRFLGLVKEAGLPPPAMNFYVAGRELDAYWEAERFAVELDTYETHGSHAAFEDDRLREDDLLLADIETIRITGPRLDREPKAIIRRVTKHLERRRRAFPRASS